MSKTPVVFVPGLGGSFNLLVMLDWRGPTLDGWDFPPFVDYGKAFLDGFARAGYTRNKDVFVAFYDWRKSVGESAANYLVRWIDRAKAASGSDKVILVGHSMGGLVSRAYIQGNAYRGDVERLITLGTPHRGSAESYYPWEGAEIRWGVVASAVLNVYLWYIQHIHPFQTGLNRLRTIRTQVPGARDLLPLDDYLDYQGPPSARRAVALMKERNLLGDMLLSPGGLDTLLARVPLATVTGNGFLTINGLVVQDPPAPPEDPPVYVDGRPVDVQTTGEGDGTVALSSARIDDPRVRNLPPVTIAHDQLPDKAFDRVMVELGITPPAQVMVPAPVPRLVIMTASPVELTIEPPAAAPVVLGEEGGRAPRRRTPRVRARNYGHSGKRLNLAVIPQPASGSYNIRLRGTGSGAFALGALIVGAPAPAVLGAEDGPAPGQPATTSISTASGEVAAQTELIYQVEVVDVAAPPLVRFDAGATARDALARLGAATTAPPPMVLGEEIPAPAISGVLSAADVPDDLRDTVSAALTQGDGAAIERLVALLASADADTLRLIALVAEQVVGPKDRDLALGLLEQLRQVALGGAGR
jgi:pimeloyl-ACP methyl ester carboxylesterase